MLNNNCKEFYYRKLLLSQKTIPPYFSLKPALSRQLECACESNYAQDSVQKLAYRDYNVYNIISVGKICTKGI